jgi:hypothetical protein
MKLNSLRTSLTAGLVYLLASSLPPRMKRMVLLASVSGRLKEPGTFNNETLAKLNRVMEMGHRDSALMIPVQLSKAIWHGQTSREIIEDEPSSINTNEDRVVRAARRFYERAPKWLHYGPEEAVVPDLIKLLRMQPSVLG